MFKNKSLENIDRISSQISATEMLISEAEFCGDLETVNHYSNVIKALEKELATLVRNHKQSLTSEHELVYSC